MLRWKPQTDFNQGLQQTVDYYKNQRNLTHPEVTVVITTYNSGSFLKEAVESVFAQTYPLWNLIIVDDASTDNSVSFLHSELQDPRVQLIVNRTNLGQTKSLNKALAKVTTPFMIQLDSDDWIYPNTLRILMSEAERIDEDVAVIGGNIKLVWQDKEGNIVKSSIRKGSSFSDPYRFMLSNKSIWPRFYRTAALHEVGGWPVDGPFQGRFVEDLRILYLLIGQFRFHWIDRILYIHRRHSNNMTNQKDKMKKTLYWLINRTLTLWGREYTPQYKLSSYGYPRLVALIPRKKGKKKLHR
jgi:glycosyltransferase involved in cell wall biosynthesis